MPPRVTAIVFEGGAASSAVAEAMQAVRHAVVLDNIARLAGVPSIADILLLTDAPGLAADAERLGARGLRGPQGAFHFGRELRRVIDSEAAEAVLYMSGAAAPLITAGDLADIAARLQAGDDVVVVNNVQSADIVAFHPARAIHGIALPPTDNFLGYLLREAGLKRVLIPNSARVNYDLDTPTDLLILREVPGAGRRTQLALSQLDWDGSRLRAAVRCLDRPGAEVSLFGRVGPAVVAFLNCNFKCRVRVFSEERGMKALGRQERGEVVSLIGHHIDAIGPNRFFAELSGYSTCAFIDTRVLMAHWREPVAEADRYHSDLGRWQAVRHQRLREFTRAAVEAALPVVLGGHSLVAGGLWAVAESVLQAEGREVVNPG
ncbi:MAG: hypothetical protein AB1492_03660 [Bacillota bacterium]